MTVFVQVTHTIKPLTAVAFDSYVDAYGEIVVPAFERHGFDMVGAFKWSSGPLGRDMLLVRFDSLAAMEKANQSLAKDTKVMEGLGRVLAASGGRLAEHMVAAYAVPYSTEARLQALIDDKPDSPRQYMLATLGLQLGAQPEAYKLIGELVETMEANTSWRLAAGYEVTVGPRGQLLDLWMIGDRVGNLSYRPGNLSPEFLTALRRVAPEEAFDYLNPLPYSPLQ